MILAATPIDQLTDVSSLDVMIARVVAVVLALVIAGLLLLLVALFRKIRTMAATLGQRPDTGGPADDGHGKTIAAMTSLSIEQGNEILAAVKFQAAVIAAHFEEVDAVLAKRGPILDQLRVDVTDIRTSQHDQGERLGNIDGRLHAVGVRQSQVQGVESGSSLPITPTPTPHGGSS